MPICCRRSNSRLRSCSSTWSEGSTDSALVSPPNSEGGTGGIGSWRTGWGGGIGGGGCCKGVASVGGGCCDAAAGVSISAIVELGLVSKKTAAPLPISVVGCKNA